MSRPAHSIDRVEREIKEALTPPDRGGEPYELPLEATYLRDFAKIGSFLTDKAKCLRHLEAISTALLVEVERLGMRRRGSTFGGKKKDLLKKEFTYTSPREGVPPITQIFRDTNGLLKNFLDQWESDAGFNQTPTSEGALPPRPPELTEFVSAGDFRTYLLKHGYHWTDTAVGGRHGEFTHRLHWFIVCKEQEKNPNWLTHQPLDLYKKCGDPVCVNPALPTRLYKNVWDQVFDNGNDGNVFRSPENLHAELRLETNMKKKSLWVLCQMINARARMAETIGKSTVTQDFQKFESDALDQLVLRGDKTGMGGPTPGTIMWREAQSTPAFWTRV